MNKTEVDYTVIYCCENDINTVINNIRKLVNKYTIKGYQLQGGVSIAIDPNGMFYATQTVIKERNKTVKDLCNLETTTLAMSIQSPLSYSDCYDMLLSAILKSDTDKFMEIKKIKDETI